MRRVGCTMWEREARQHTDDQRQKKKKKNNNNLFYQDMLYSCLYLYLHSLCHEPHRSDQPGVIIQRWMRALGQETQGTGSKTHG